MYLVHPLGSKVLPASTIRRLSPKATPPPARARYISHVSGAVSFLSRVTPKFCLNAGTFRLVNTRHEAQNLTAGSCAGGKLSTMPIASFKYSWYFACSTRPRDGGGREAQNMLPCWAYFYTFWLKTCRTHRCSQKKQNTSFAVKLAWPFSALVNRNTLNRCEHDACDTAPPTAMSIHARVSECVDPDGYCNSSTTFA